MARFDTQDLPHLLERLYDAALYSQRWQDFLNALPRSFGGACGILHLCVGETRAFINFGNDPEYEASYVEHFASVNPYPARGFHALPIGKVLYATDLVDAASVERTQFFNDWMKPQGISPDHMGVSLFNDQREVTLLSIAPHASVQGRERETYFRQLELLTPHLMRAVEINRAMAGARRSNLILGGTLDALGRAVFVLNARGRLLDANARAEALMRAEDRPVHIDRCRILHADRSEDDHALSASVASIAAATHRPMLPLRLASRRTGAPYLAWLIPIAPPRNGPPSTRLSLVESFDSDLTILMLVSPVRCSAHIPAEAIQTALGLSAAEARLASALVAGRTVTEYAKDAGLSSNTARNQLASIFAKTATTRQTLLVTLIHDALGPVAGRGNGMA